MEMGIWLLDRAIQKLFHFKYHQGYENLADYPSKSNPGTHHLAVRPFYIHLTTSTRVLSRADRPSMRQGCVNKAGPTYIRNPIRPHPKHVDHVLPATAA
jgi:hypothetical protein